MGKRGPKPKFNNPNDFMEAVKGYINDCEKKGVFPDEAGMRIYLGLKKRTLTRLSSETENPENWEAYRDALDYAKDARESYLARKMTSDNKAAQGCFNALKQPSNGGYIDRPVDSGKIELKIKVDGIGGMDMFK